MPFQFERCHSVWKIYISLATGAYFQTHSYFTSQDRVCTFLRARLCACLDTCKCPWYRFQERMVRRWRHVLMHECLWRHFQARNGAVTVTSRPTTATWGCSPRPTSAAANTTTVPTGSPASAPTRPSASTTRHRSPGARCPLIYQPLYGHFR